MPQPKAKSPTKPRPTIHVLDYGDPGSWKSTFAATFPKPMLVSMFDGTGKDTPYLKMGEFSPIEISKDGIRRRVVETTDGQIVIEYYNDLSPGSRDWEFYEWRLRRRAFLDEGFVTLVKDSVTSMELAARKYAESQFQSKDPRKYWGASTDALETALITEIQGLDTINVVVLAHISSSKDEVNGEFLRNPSAPGRLEAKNMLAMSFGELYRSYVYKDSEGERHGALQTLSDQRFNAATQIGASDPCLPTYEALWENWR